MRTFHSSLSKLNKQQQEEEREHQGALANKKGETHRIKDTISLCISISLFLNFNLKGPKRIYKESLRRNHFSYLARSLARLVD